MMARKLVRESAQKGIPRTFVIEFTRVRIRLFECRNNLSRRLLHASVSSRWQRWHDFRDSVIGMWIVWRRRGVIVLGVIAQHDGFAAL